MATKILYTTTTKNGNKIEKTQRTDGFLSQGFQGSRRWWSYGSFGRLSFERAETAPGIVARHKQEEWYCAFDSSCAGWTRWCYLVSNNDTHQASISQLRVWLASPNPRRGPRNLRHLFFSHIAIGTTATSCQCQGAHNLFAPHFG